jgi:hypothetical protein
MRPRPMETPAFLNAIKYVNEIINLNKPWTDNDFPPKIESLANKNDPLESIHKMANTQWKRASEIYTKPS